jgi:hypothetical protein
VGHAAPGVVVHALLDVVAGFGDKANVDSSM